MRSSESLREQIASLMRELGDQESSVAAAAVAEAAEAWIAAFRATGVEDIYGLRPDGEEALFRRLMETRQDLRDARSAARLSIAAPNKD